MLKPALSSLISKNILKYAPDFVLNSKNPYIINKQAFTDQQEITKFRITELPLPLHH